MIDNEGQGKKKSKSKFGSLVVPHVDARPQFSVTNLASLSTLLVCCIYHKPKRFDESSDESSDESDDGRAKPSSSSKRKAKPHHHHHDHDHSHDSGDQTSSSSSSNSSTPNSSTQQPTVSATMTELQQPRNAYESLPRRGNDGESEGKLMVPSQVHPV